MQERKPITDQQRFSTYLNSLSDAVGAIANAFQIPPEYNGQILCLLVLDPEEIATLPHPLGEDITTHILYTRANTRRFVEQNIGDQDSWTIHNFALIKKLYESINPDQSTASPEPTPPVIK